MQELVLQEIAREIVIEANTASDLPTGKHDDISVAIGLVAGPTDTVREAFESNFLPSLQAILEGE